jgi:hypothetical protein
MDKRLFPLLAAGMILGAYPVAAGPAEPAAKRAVGEKQESLDVRYARMKLELAEANLQKVQRMNQRVPGAVPAEVIREYQQDVEVARSRLQAAAGGGGGNPFQTWVSRAEAAARSAELEWNNALAVNRRTPGTVEAIDLERLRLRSEVARLDLERGQALLDASPEAQRQWQVGFLENEVQRLNEEVLRKPPSQRAYPLWWWY